MALPPQAYEEWKRSAPEVCSVELLNVTTEAGTEETTGTVIKLRRTRIAVTAEAKVIAVERSSSGLAAGAEIRIEYVHLPLRQEVMRDGQWGETWMTGPAPIPILEKGQKATAWIERIEDNRFKPAAESESFLLAPADTTKTD